jgi:LCP family protein required for cell wall assembly
MLSVAFVVSALAVIVLAALTVREVMARPLNPYEGNPSLAEAAQEVADVSLPPLEQDGALPPVITDPDVPAPTPLPTSIPQLDESRTTILVMGVDRRPGEAFISRTDTMMLISIDKENNSAAILSIPRDLYVIIPGRGRERINTAFVYGAAGNNPAGGAMLAMQTVEYNLGVPVNHYVAVDFSAVINGVDALGGIDIYVPKEIYDPTFPDMNYGYDPLYVPAGQQSMDGLTALKYARTRHVDNDFNRARRQQDVIMAVRDRVLQLGVTEMFRRGPALYNELREGIRTDMSLEEILAIANTASQIPEENIETAVLDYQYVTSYTTQNGAQVLILINNRAATLISDLFYGDSP